MTRHLTLVRHAKSSWRDRALADHERPLSGRGERDAPAMAVRMKARGDRPSLILTSSAVRARATAAALAGALDYPWERVGVEPSLYLAPPGGILEVVASQADEHESIVLVGHNPGLTELVQRLLPQLQLDNLPTGGIVAMQLECGRWRDVERAETRLRYFDYPKNPAADGTPAPG